MSRPLPTFSALPRAFACPLSAVLPQADHVSEHAEAGTVRHHFLRRISDLTRGGMPLDPARQLALAEAPEYHRCDLALLPVGAMRLKEVQAEVAFAIDGRSGRARVLGHGIDRAYDAHGRGPDDFAGSLDRLALLGSDGIYVGDYKPRSHTRRADQDEQLLAGALAAVRVHNRRWAEIEIIRLIDGRMFPSKACVAARDLEQFWVRLSTLRLRILEDRAAFAAGALPAATTGDHCRYCPALRYCPAKMGLARAALGSDLADVLRAVRAREQLVTPETAPRLREAVQDLDALVRILKADLADFAAQTPIPQRDGRVYGRTPSGRIAAHRPRPPQPWLPRTRHLGGLS